MPEPHTIVGLPRWARFLLAMMPLGIARDEVGADFAELFNDRRSSYGGWYAHRRLAADITSLWRRVGYGGHMSQDLRFAFRLFRKHPGPVWVAVLGLGLAIGVVTTAFSLLNATRLRPYGMDDPDSVVQVTQPQHGRYFAQWSYARFLEMQRSTSLVGIEAAMEESARISVRAGDEGVAARPMSFVSGGYLELLGGRTMLGRSLTRDDDLPSATPVVVISHRLWVTQFEANPDVLGRPLWFNGSPATVVGVMRPGFSAPGYIQPLAWAPFAAFDDLLKVAQSYTVSGRVPASMLGDPFSASARTQVDVVARLRADIPAAIAEQELSSIVNAAAAVPASAKPTPPINVRLFSAASPIEGPDAAESWLEVASLLGLVGLVLAVACANAANLLLASAATRSREIGVRLALGASRRRLWMQMITESVLLGVLASTAGLFLAWWLAPVVANLVALDPGIDVTPDGRVIFFAAAVAVVCGLGAAVAPARFGSRGRIVDVLQVQGAFGGRAMPSRLRSSFLGGQAAVSMLLLAAAALLGRTALHIVGTDVGFDSTQVLSVTLTTPAAGFDEALYLQRAQDALRALPSVAAVGMTQRRPFGGSTRYLSDRAAAFSVLLQETDAGFFQAAGVRLLRGRLFTDPEVRSGAAVAVVSESVANRSLARRDPIGQPLSSVFPVSADRDAIIVGVVGDVMLFRPRAEAVGTVFTPIARVDASKEGTPTLVVRTANPAALARVVEDTLRPLDARARAATWVLQNDVDAVTGSHRMLVWVAVPVAALSLLLAILGVYGVTSFVVTRRTGEVSVRMALGATVADVSRLLVRDSLRPVAIGVVVGLLSALAAGQVFRSVLPGISPHDPLAIGAAATVLTLAAFLAVLLPIRAVARVDPAVALRQS